MNEEDQELFLCVNEEDQELIVITIRDKGSEDCGLWTP